MSSNVDSLHQDTSPCQPDGDDDSYLEPVKETNDNPRATDDPNYIKLVHKPGHEPGILTGNELGHEPGHQLEDVYYEIDDSHEPETRAAPPSGQPPPLPFARSVRKSLRKQMSRVNKSNKCNRYVVCLIVLLVVVTAAFATAAAAVFLKGGNSSKHIKEFYGRMWLDALEYNSSTHGNSGSPKYKDLETKFSSKTMKTLLGNDIIKDVQRVEVTGFSKGSVVVHFKVVFLMTKSKEETQRLLTKLLHDEMGKESGQFRQYIRNVDAPRVTFNPDGAATISTSKPTTTTIITTSTVRTTPMKTKPPPTTTKTTKPPATTTTTTTTTTKTKPSPTTTKTTMPPATTTTTTTTTTTKTKPPPTTTKTTKPPPTTTTTTTTTSTTKTKSQPMTTTIKLPGPTYCQIHAPCQNGGTCVDLAGDSYVCVCPKCNCSRAEPFGDCVVDMDTICRKEDLPPHNNVPHPYNCKKYVKCTSDGRATTVMYVWMHEDGSHVFNPKTDLSDFTSNVECAREIVVRTLCANVTCVNGGMCEDTRSGFKCRCMSGYMGSKCQTRV